MRENGRSERPQNRTDATLSGRSMVELLGVLAIIGVLSVGAMSSYSKAMFKYKLNKQAEQLSTLFNEAVIYAKQFSFNNSKSRNDITPTFIKLGLVPVEMIKGSNSNYIYDIFNNQISIFKSGKTATVPDTMSVHIEYDNKENQNDIAMCRNVIIAIKENAAILYQLSTRSNGSGNPSPSNHTSTANMPLVMNSIVSAT